MSVKDIHNLDYTILLCSKLQETRAFYADVMGFPIELEQENWINFRVGAALLTLRPRGRGFNDGFLSATQTTEFLVVDKFGDGGMIAARWALGVAAELELAESHGKRIVQNEASDQGLA